MILRLKIAIRNVLRNRGRTFVNLLMVSGAVIGQVTFAGFSEYILSEMRQVMIDQFGHIQIAQKDLWDLKPGKRKHQLISSAADLIKNVKTDSGVAGASGRLTFFGLLSTGEMTVSAKGLGFRPDEESSFGRHLVVSLGTRLNADSNQDVVIGGGLAKKINLQVGNSVTVLAYTLDGVVNAVDLQVQGIFFTGNSEIDDNLFVLPLQTAQTLLDTEQVEVVAVHLKEASATIPLQARLEVMIQRMNPKFHAKTWYELASFYVQVESFFGVQNFVIQLILLSLVFLGILNTIGMSVHERTGEIGTLRSLGESPLSILKHFILEGFMFGVIGSLFGVLLGVVIGRLITFLNFTMQLPGTSTHIPISIYFMPSAYLQAVGVSIGAAIIATLVPAYRATKVPIVDALRRNI